jgi:hypothetical protein
VNEEEFEKFNVLSYNPSDYEVKGNTILKKTQSHRLIYGEYILNNI